MTKRGNPESFRGKDPNKSEIRISKPSRTRRRSRLRQLKVETTFWRVPLLVCDCHSSHSNLFQQSQISVQFRAEVLGPAWGWILL